MPYFMFSFHNMHCMCTGRLAKAFYFAKNLLCDIKDLYNLVTLSSDKQWFTRPHMKLPSALLMYESSGLLFFICGHVGSNSFDDPRQRYQSLATCFLILLKVPSLFASSQSDFNYFKLILQWVSSLNITTVWF